ncbi:MAG: 6-phosphogluconolactonase [Pontixanthobacter sp.]
MENLTIVDNAPDRGVSDWLETRLADALMAQSGPVSVCMPGGSTPFPIMRLLAHSAIDWSRIVIWPSDDRVVPEDHAASNTGKLRALFEPIGATVMALTIMEQVPPFALVWLGMGADGHVASLFPNTDPHVDDDRRMRRLTPDPLPADAPFDRVTLTLPALLDSTEILLVMRGDDKRAVLDAAMRGDSDMPIARLLKAARQPVTCFV